MPTGYYPDYNPKIYYQLREKKLGVFHFAGKEINVTLLVQFAKFYTLEV